MDIRGFKNIEFTGDERNKALSVIDLLTPGGEKQLFKGTKKVERITRSKIKNQAALKVYIVAKLNYVLYKSDMKIINDKIIECQSGLSQKERDKIIAFVKMDYEKQEHEVDIERIVTDAYIRSEFNMC